MINDLAELTKALKIENWDLLLIGDGSGSRWGNATGWACTAIPIFSQQRFLFYGAANNGTVNTAELQAYLLPLLWFASLVEERPPRTYNIHIVTDSKYTADMSSGSRPPGKNAIFWHAFKAMAGVGFNLHWHFMPRESSTLNQAADRLSRASRVKFTELRLGSPHPKVSGTFTNISPDQEPHIDSE